jgi:hypothetical protein
MPDDFANHDTGLTSPAQSATAILPSDSTDLPRATRALYVGQAGDLKVRMVSGEVILFAGVLAGALYPLRVDRVLATGTTASGLVGLS